MSNKEVIWDSNLAAAVADEVIRIEEGVDGPDMLTFKRAATYVKIFLSDSLSETLHSRWGLKLMGLQRCDCIACVFSSLALCQRQRALVL
jgi:hypothetical protein